MKIPIIALLLLFGSAFIWLRTDAARSLLDEVKNNRARDQAAGETQTGQTLEASKTGRHDIEPKESQEESDPAADSNDQTSTSNTADGNSKNEDEKNDNYGTYGNPSGSSTETHHRFTDVDRPH